MFPLVDKEKTAKNIKRYMTRSKLSAKDVQEYLGLTCVQTVYRWLEGVSIPSVDNLYALCSLFQVSMNDIVNGNSAFNDIKQYREAGSRYISYYMHINKIIYEKEFYI